MMHEAVGKGCGFIFCHASDRFRSWTLSNGDMIRKAQWAAAIFGTLLAVWLHFLFMQYAGGLWRDEVGAVNLAQ
jgi:hypothetical protein